MKFYHYDRRNSLNAQVSLIEAKSPINKYIEADMLIKSIFSNGINRMALTYLNECAFDDNNPNNQSTFIAEYIFETVRRLEYPDLPSRFTSIYAAKNLEELKYWIDVLQRNYTYDSNDANIKIVETEKFVYVDSCWRDFCIYSDFHKLNLNPFLFHYYARQYWSGEMSEEPKPEVLCGLPVTIIEMKPV